MLHLLIHRFELPESEQHDHLSVNPKPSLYLRRALHFAQNLQCSLAAGITMFLVGSIFHTIVPVLFPEVQLQYETESELFRRWKGIWTETYMMVHPFLFGSVFAAVFLALRKRTAFPAGFCGGLTYGAGVFCVWSLPVFVLAFASFVVPAEIISLWILQNLCQYLAAGLAVGRVAEVKAP